MTIKSLEASWPVGMMEEVVARRENAEEEFILRKREGEGEAARGGESGGKRSISRVGAGYRGGDIRAPPRASPGPLGHRGNMRGPQGRACE